MKNGYDNASLYYDRLSKLIFGNNLLLAQQYLIPFIPSGANILIAGGGSGWILEAIRKVYPSGLSITYVDSSPKMIAKAAKCNCGSNNITFIAGQLEEVNLTGNYDVIITPFFFDNFTDTEAILIFEKLHNALAANGQWLYTDFQNTSGLKHRILLRSMYLFFGMLCGVKTRQLPDTDRLFNGAGLVIHSEQLFINGFVSSRIYRTNSTTKN